MKERVLNNPRVEFFDLISCEWDNRHHLNNLSADFESSFDEFGIHPEETVVDLGCGTGNMTIALLKHLNETGRVIALDISPGMLRRAQAKCSDSRALWFLSDAESMPMAKGTCDRVICFSAWPHFEDDSAVIREIRRVLKPGGQCHILHFISRKSVNSIHSEAHPSVISDVLPPVDELAGLFRENGFSIKETADNNKAYLLTALKK
ncbi:MAG: class I SAM-dependent methyltransferase [Kiritimatiellia bacterium]